MYNYTIEKATRNGTRHESYGVPNEDRHVVVYVNDFIWMGIFDGVSKGGGGGEAADLAARAMESVLQETIAAHDCEATGLEIIRRAQKSILDATTQKAVKLQTTGVVACIDRRAHTLTWFSIGDSAAFIYPKRKRPVKLTVEDTDIGESLASGTITKVEAESATVGHELNRWLGMQVAPEEIGCFIRRGRESLAPGDIVLVCSDGFHSFVRPCKTKRILLKGEGPESLIKQALRSGSRDDITVVCARPETRSRQIPLTFAIALSAFLFACGFWLGTKMLMNLQGEVQCKRLDIQEETQDTFPDDTLTINIEER